MVLRVIACEVFARELNYCAALSPHTVDLVFTDKAAHDRSDNLRAIVQGHIDEAEASGRQYDAVALGFGLCGNSTAGVGTKRLPFVVPRAHDCCTLFLGSKRRYRELFEENPSRPFSSAGYYERGSGNGYLRESTLAETLGTNRTYEQYVELYGEENARYIMETLGGATLAGQDHVVVFVDMPEFAHLGYAEQFRRQAEADGKEFLHVRGDIRLFRKLVNGEWDGDDFLVLDPGGRVEPCYDWDEVIRASANSPASG